MKIKIKIFKTDVLAHILAVNKQLQLPTNHAVCQILVQYQAPFGG